MLADGPLIEDQDRAATAKTLEISFAREYEEDE